MKTALALALLAATAHASPPPPTGPHPRMLLDADLKKAWQAQAKLAHGPVVGAIKVCGEAGTTHEHDHALYQGAEWAKVVQACLVAWAATDDDAHAQTAIRFFTALLDDLDVVGDGKGGDKAASRDDGYAIRNLGPYTALAYDWLHDKIPAATRDRALARWKVWLERYEQKGYSPHTPGTNSHAGSLIAATPIAIAEAGEAGAESDSKWKLVADQMWDDEMRHAMSQGGILDGGDWPEGWQYAPLSMAEYALGARVMAKTGVALPTEAWLDGVLRRHVYALSPAGQTYAAGDTETETANVPVGVLTLAAVALGDASADDKKWARGELSRLQLADQSYLMYDALAGVGDKPVLPPRDKWATWYLAEATGNLYSRTRWDEQAVWTVLQCSHSLDVDHRHPDAGNIAISRGTDDALVDPSPYGSLSTLTSNAPTVLAGKLPDDYKPSQAEWGDATWLWTAQTASGVLAARCDYADTFKFQERKTDVPMAMRDFVVLPAADGTSATVIVVDAADTGSDDRGMYLRFRTQAPLALDGDRARATVGGTQLTIATVAKTSGTPALARPTLKDCYQAGTKRGGCDASRFPITEYKLELAGEHPRAVHAISVTDDKIAAAAAPLAGDGWAGVHVTGVRDAVVVWPTGDAMPSYRAPKGDAVTHVVLAGGTLAAHADGDSCAVDVTAGPAKPIVAFVDRACAVKVDPESPRAASAQLPKVPGGGRGKRNGCCRAQAVAGRLGSDGDRGLGIAAGPGENDGTTGRRNDRTTECRMFARKGFLNAQTRFRRSVVPSSRRSVVLVTSTSRAPTSH